MNKNNVMKLWVLAGTAAGCFSNSAYANDEVLLYEHEQNQLRYAAHLYVNADTQERVITLIDSSQTSGAESSQSSSVWSTTGGTGCSGTLDSAFVYIDTCFLSSTLSSGTTLVDWGDIPVDTVIDCVQVNWVTEHDDTDMNSDGIGDGVEGFAAEWTFWDADNGRALNGSTRLPIISILLTDLPGNPDSDGVAVKYTADIDLTAPNSSSSLVFEIGDSDGDLQGAAFGNNNIDINSDGIGDGVSVAGPGVDRDMNGLDDSDLDGDGLFDWSWGVRFYQPGTRDFDGDGVLDGNFGCAPSGVCFGLPIGQAVQGPDGSWRYEIDESQPDAAHGVEDALAFYSGDEHLGVFWLGGFSCDPDQETLFTTAAIKLYGPSGVSGGCSVADLAEPFGELNFFDVSSFLLAFNQMSSEADLAAPFGEWNFFDISEFLNAYHQGCP